MLENVAERVSSKTDRRNIVAIVGPPKSGKNTVCYLLYNMLNKKMVMVSTTYYIAMEFARIMVSKKGLDPDVCWENTLMLCQEVMWGRDKFEPMITEFEFEINKDHEQGIIGSLIDKTDYKFNIIESIKDPKELNALNKHNTLYIAIFRESCESDFPLFMIPNKDMIIVNNNGTLEELAEDLNKRVIPVIREKFNP